MIAEEIHHAGELIWPLIIAVAICFVATFLLAGAKAYYGHISQRKHRS